MKLLGGFPHELTEILLMASNPKKGRHPELQIRGDRAHNAHPVYIVVATAMAVICWCQYPPKFEEAVPFQERSKGYTIKSLHLSNIVLFHL